jgi:uncharacterized membrane protein YeaQ/YmgE (transglycosylase-associated protein family)
MSLLWFILIGLVAGWLARQLVKSPSGGLAIDLVIGIIGALIGGALVGELGLRATGLIGSLVTATLGSIILLVALRFFRQGRV